MNNIARIQMTLTRIAEVLRFGENQNWTPAFESFERNFRHHPRATCARILSSYGGMGLFNDVVLYRNGQPLTTENEELDYLRTELFKLCRE